MWEFRAKKTDRLDRLLRQESFSGSEWLSRQAWEWLLENGRIQASGRKCSKSGAVISEGTPLTVEWPSSSLGLLKSERSANLLWSDESLAIFSKSCGISTVPLFPWDSSALANEIATTLESSGIISAFNFSLLSSPPILEGGLLQRLDRHTSGIVCVALDAKTKLLFRQLFSQSKMEKTYLAIVAGDLAGISGLHKIWLGGQGGPKVKAQLTAPPNGDSQSSSLGIEILHQENQCALVKVQTNQGARHIVRAGMAALGAPLVGDTIYGGSDGAPFHQLHALSLRLPDLSAYPSFPNGIEAPLPFSFLDSLRKLGLHYTPR